MPYGVLRNVAADLSADEHNQLIFNTLRAIRRINPTCAIKNIYHLETTDFNRWVKNYHETHLTSFQKHHI